MPKQITDLDAATLANAADLLLLRQGSMDKRIRFDALMKIIATGSTTVRPIADRFAEVFNIADEGASPSASAADNTTAIQATFNKAVAAVCANVVFPHGTYDHNALTLVPSSGQIHVNLIGLGGALGVVLNYKGAGGVALTIKNNTRCRLMDLALTNGGTGTPTGLFISSLAPGSNCGPYTFMNVVINGFNKNYVVGATTGEAASEFTYHNFEVSGGVSHGIELNGQNSLDHQFYGLNMAGNATGLEAVDPDCIFIHGGSASNQTVQDFAFRPAGAFCILGYRSEGAERFVTFGPDGGAGSGSPTVAVIQACRIATVANSDKRAIRLNKAGHYTINKVHSPGHVYINSGNVVSGSLELKGNAIISTTDLEIAAGSYNWKIDKDNNTDSTTGAGDYWPSGKVIVSANGVNPPLELSDDFLGDVLADQWNTRVGTDAQCTAAAILASQPGGYIRMITGNDGTNDMVTDGTLLEHARNWQIDSGALSMEIRVRMNATDIALFFGFKDTVGSGALANIDMPFTLAAGDVLTSNAVDAFGVLYDPNADTDNWWGVGVKNNVDATKQNFGVAPSGNVWATWRIDYRGDGVYFYLDNVLKGSKMSNPVSASVALTPCVVAFARNGADRLIDIDYIKVMQNR